MAHTLLRLPNEYADTILDGDEYAIEVEDLTRYFAGESDVWETMAAADKVRRHYFANTVHLCSIVNAKQGGCPEDCGFCSQSKHFSTHVSPERFIAPQEAIEASQVAQDQNSSALGLVAAIRGLEDGSKALDLMVDRVRAIKDAGHTEAHASLGLVSEDGFRRLKEAGLTEYNHNLESSRNFFSKIVSTHSYDDRIATIKAAKANGLRTCVGGIMGMGESPRDRAEFALELRKLDVDEVPINFLVSIEGTTLSKINPMEPLEMLRTLACFRLALPRQNIFVAAGRSHLGQLQPLMFSAGASGMMIGDYLTTPNRSVEDDHKMIADLGLVPRTCGTKTTDNRLSSPVRTSIRARRASLPVLQA